MEHMQRHILTVVNLEGSTLLQKGDHIHCQNVGFAKTIRHNLDCVMIVLTFYK